MEAFLQTLKYFRSIPKATATKIWNMLSHPLEEMVLQSKVCFAKLYIKFIFILNGFRFLYHTSNKPIMVFKRDENNPTHFEKSVKRDSLNIFNSKPYILAYHYKKHNDAQKRFLRYPWPNWRSVKGDHLSYFVRVPFWTGQTYTSENCTIFLF